MGNSRNNSILWELLPPDGAKSSYLFGSIHLPDKTLYHRIDEVEKLIDRVDCFMAEYMLDEGNEDHQNAFLLPESKGLYAYISEKKFEKLRKQLLKSFSVDIDGLHNYKPMIIENLLASSLLDEPVPYPMDVHLWNYAKSHSKVMMGAESFESQIRIMNNFPIKQQVSSFLKLGSNPSKYRKLILKMREYYKEEKLRSLYKISMSTLGNMRASLVYQRNIKITESIHLQMEKHSLLCVVGAGHLDGYKGLLRLLKHKGIKLKAL